MIHNTRPLVASRNARTPFVLRPPSRPAPFSGLSRTTLRKGEVYPPVRGSVLNQNNSQPPWGKNQNTRSPLFFFDLFWCFWDFDLFWFILIYIELYWIILNYIELYWFILIYIDLFWFILIYFDSQERIPCFFDSTEPSPMAPSTPTMCFRFYFKPPSSRARQRAAARACSSKAG